MNHLWKAPRTCQAKREDCHCQDCGERFPVEELDTHHVVPVPLGGSNQLDNLLLLCRDCHRGSGWYRHHACLVEAGLAVPPKGTQLQIAS